MMKKVRIRERAIWLTVDEVTDLISAFENAKSQKHLDGQQREHLEVAILHLTEAKSSALRGKVEVNSHTAELVVRCVIYTQRWLWHLYDDFAGID